MVYFSLFPMTLVLDQSIKEAGTGLIALAKK